ncbi:MAG TPA: serine hydrolase [Burkholderiales bacterium]|nr:serine hydrolase [Burkholderiales bacterium]
MLRRLALLALFAAGCAHAQQDRYPRVADAYLVKRDGMLLWAGRAGDRLPPASLAKMMTALLVLENGDLDRVIVLDRGVALETGRRLGLSPGEKWRVRDLFTAMVVRSANDACRALADDAGPSAPKFVDRMNRRAAALGLRDTHFADPCGHDREQQYSSAQDLARLAEEVIRYPDYLRLAGRRQAAIRSADGTRSFAFDNTNALIGRYPGAIGVKTGYTELAGTCLVALAERDGVRVLVVMLNARNRWWQAVGLLDRAFDARPQ